MVAVLAIMVILLAVLGAGRGQRAEGQPWGVFTILCTIPIAFCMGFWMKVWRPGQDAAKPRSSGVVLLLVALVAGRWVAALADARLRSSRSTAVTIAWAIIVYGFVASVLPVWLLLCPRDYLSTFMKIGTIVVLGARHPARAAADSTCPAVTRFIDGTGPVFAGKLFPFCFITIACGAISRLPRPGGVAAPRRR